ncbi:hypothetical protein AB3U99_03070 [Niallia sp. JL1B1071]|uniref:hypothetical protein n=1 Tax=Niallia tiangongensis TaxID=3237105 RepID=UPI0037DD7B75
MEGELIGKIVRILSQREEKQKVLVLLFCSTHNQKEIHELLKKYRQDFDYTFLFSDNLQQLGVEEQWLDLGEKADGYRLIAENDLQNFDGVFVPFFTRNSLAKIVNGISDNFTLTVLQHLFLMNKPILVSSHSFKTDTDYAIYRELDQNEFINQMINAQEEMLKKMGAKVGTLIEFKTCVEEFASKKIQSDDSTKKGENQNFLFNASYQKFQKQVDTRGELLTLKDVQQNPDMALRQGVKFTDLAAEYLDEYQRRK